MTPRTHGGRRPGAGRKPLGHASEGRHITMPAAFWRAIDDLDERSWSAALAAAIADDACVRRMRAALVSAGPLV